mgnify:FL=1
MRLYVLAALFFIVAAVYIGVLYDTQVNKYDYYYASSVRSIARWELSSSTINIIGGVLISYLLASGGNRSGRPPFRKGGSRTPRRRRCRTRRTPPGGNAISVFSALLRCKRPPEETRTSFPAHPKTSKLRHTFYEFIGPLLRTAEDFPTIQ